VRGDVAYLVVVHNRSLGVLANCAESRGLIGIPGPLNGKSVAPSATFRYKETAIVS
jgi:hypothetical protein